MRQYRLHKATLTPREIKPVQPIHWENIELPNAMRVSEIPELDADGNVMPEYD